MEQSKAIKQAAASAKRPGIIRFFASMGQYIAGVCRDFMQGDLWVKLSALLWGSSCVARGQYVKGVLLTVLEALFAYFIPVVFWPSMKQAGHPGHGTAAAGLQSRDPAERVQRLRQLLPHHALWGHRLRAAAHGGGAVAAQHPRRPGGGGPGQGGQACEFLPEDIADCFGVKFHRHAPHPAGAGRGLLHHYSPDCDDPHRLHQL